MLSKSIWELQVPLKVRVFIWLVVIDKIFIMAKLIKHKWPGPTQGRSFCDHKENADHLFLKCLLSKKFLLILKQAFGISGRPRSLQSLIFLEGQERHEEIEEYLEFCYYSFLLRSMKRKEQQNLLKEIKR